MLFRSDFIEALEEYGRLPFANYKEQLAEIAVKEEEIARLHESKVQNEMLQDANKKL